MTSDCREILRFLNCKYEIFENEKNSSVIMDRYKELKEAGKNENFVPLIIVPNDILAETLSFIYEDYDVEESQAGIQEFREKALEEAESIDVNEFLKERFNEYNDMHDNDVMGNFKYSEPSNEFITFEDANGIPFPEVLIVKIPETDPWKAAVWMPMGGFNDCPTPAEQAAVFKFWYEKYGAVPGAVTYDNWELYIDKPLKENNELEGLAEEQFAFCYDIVMQGCGDIRSLASCLRNSHVWYFWWD
ncbi:DUF4253 domain-containing protein [Fusobacterium varium]